MGFFFEKRTEVLLPTSCAGVEEVFGPSPERKERQVEIAQDVKNQNRRDKMFRSVEEWKKDRTKRKRRKEKYLFSPDNTI